MILGSSAIMVQGSVSGYGENVIVNGDFPSNLDSWSLSTASIWESGAVKIPGAVGSRITQDTLEIGKTFLITFDIISTDTSGYLVANGVFPLDFLSSGSYEIELAITDIIVGVGSNSSGGYTIFDNIIAREVL